MTAPYQPKISRRTSLKWFAGTLVASLGACEEQTTPQADYEARMARQASGTLGTPKPVTGEGYGVDPDYFSGEQPWQLTMTDEQRRLTAALSDIVFPAEDGSPSGSSVGIPDFVDEWVSAPYPSQQRDRELLFEGFDWLEGQAQERFGTSFADATDAQQKEVLDLIAWRNRPSDAPDEMRRFFRTFKDVAAGAYYASEAGMAEIGYLGNKPIIGPYPGPTKEALDHLAGVLAGLGLEMPAPR